MNFNKNVCKWFGKAMCSPKLSYLHWKILIEPQWIKDFKTILMSSLS
jgi:hypothetical protein